MSKDSTTNIIIGFTIWVTTVFSLGFATWLTWLKAESNAHRIDQLEKNWENQMPLQKDIVETLGLIAGSLEKPDRK